MAAQKKETLGISVEQMVDVMSRELTIGCEDAPDVKCGFIGEVGCSWPLYGKYGKSFIWYKLSTVLFAISV